MRVDTFDRCFCVPKLETLKCHPMDSSVKFGTEVQNCVRARLGPPIDLCLKKFTRNLQFTELFILYMYAYFLILSTDYIYMYRN